MFTKRSCIVGTMLHIYKHLSSLVIKTLKVDINIFFSKEKMGAQR